MPRRTKGPEATILSAILEYLNLKKVWHRRVNTGAIMASYGGKKRIMRFGKPGDADIYCLLPKTSRDGNLVAIIAYIEVKSENGKQTDEQRRFEQSAKEVGAKYILARSLEDVALALNDWRSEEVC